MPSLLFKKFSHRTVLNFLFISMITASSLCSEIPNPLVQLPVTESITPEDKALQTRILFSIDAFSLLLHRIGVSIVNLKSLSLEQLKDAQSEIASLQESLQRLKTRNSEQVVKNQLVYATIILHELILKTELSLKAGFQVLPVLDAERIKRDKKRKNISPEEIQKFLQESNESLKNYDYLINNMNKSWINKSYTWISDRWNSPIYSITSLGGNSNHDIYLSSLLKRVGIYGAGISLLIYNTDEKYFGFETAQENDHLTWMQWLKRKIGSAPYPATISETSKGVDTEPVEATREIYLGDISKVNEVQPVLPVVQKDANNFPIIYKAGTEEQVPVTFKDGQYALATDSWWNGDWKKQNQKYEFLLTNGKSAAYSAENLFEKISFDGAWYGLDNGRTVIKEFLPGHYQTIQGDYIKPSINALQNATLIGNACQKETGYRFVNTNGLVQWVPEWAVRGGNKAYPSETTTSRNEGKESSNGIVNICRDVVLPWLYLELATKSPTIPVSAFVLNQMYEDFKIIKEDIPQIGNYLHKKLRGEEIDISSSLQTPKKTFDDIIGREEIKRKFRPVIDFVSNPESYIQQNIQMPRGFGLFGDPQTGKTTMIEALAGELTKTIRETQGVNKSVKLFTVPVHYLIQDGLRPYMERLKAVAPCILFCDEFDLTGAQRNENKAFLAEALTSLSGYTTSSDLNEFVLFVIASNRPENIDYAIHYDGRCGTHLFFENPYFQDRKDYFKHFFTKRNMKLENFNLDQIAQETEACSYGTLVRVANDILITAQEYNQVPCQKHVDIVLDEVVRKIIPEARELSEEKREVLAARYGAKAFASVVLNPDKKFVGVTIGKITEKIEEKSVLHHYEMANEKNNAGIRFGGLFSYNCADTLGLISNNELIKQCKIALAGTVGQNIIGLDYINFSEDEQEAWQIAQKIVFNGCDKMMFPKEVRRKKETEAYVLIEQCRFEMQQLLEQHKTHFEKVVNLLQRRKVLRISDIKQCFGLDDLDLVRDYWASTALKTKTEPFITEVTPAVDLNQIANLAAKSLVEQSENEDSDDEEEEEG